METKFKKALVMFYAATLIGSASATQTVAKHYNFATITDDSTATAAGLTKVDTVAYANNQLELTAAGYLHGDSGLAQNDNFILEVILNTDGLDGSFDFPLTLTDPSPTNNGYGVLLQSGNWIGFRMGAGAIQSSPFIVDQEVHLAVVRDGGVERLFVDGVEIASPANRDYGGSLARINIGANPSDGSASYFDGQINEVRTSTFDAGSFTPAYFLIPFNIAPAGTGIMGVNDAVDLSTTGTAYFQGGVITSINDETTAATVDTWNGNQPAHVGFSHSYVGINWAVPQTQIDGLKLTLNAFGDGGWFGKDEDNDPTNDGAAGTDFDLFVQTTTDGTSWTTVTQTNDYDNWTGVANSGAFDVEFTLTTPATNVTGIRIIGQEGGTASGGFIGVRELEVYGIPTAVNTIEIIDITTVTAVQAGFTSIEIGLNETVGDFDKIQQSLAGADTWTDSTWTGDIVNDSSVVVTGLTKATDYDFRGVYNTTENTPVVSASTLSAGTTVNSVDYPLLDYTRSGQNKFLNRFSILTGSTEIYAVDTTSDSSKPMYEDYTSTTPNPTSDLTIGASYTFRATYDRNEWYGVNIWADWNGDGDFDDTNETLVRESTRGTMSHEATVQIPFGLTAREVIIRARHYSADDLNINNTGPWGLLNSSFPLGTKDFKVTLVNQLIEITGYEPVDDIEVLTNDPDKDTIAELGLPSTLIIAGSGGVDTRQVTWTDNDSYDNLVAGDYTFTAVLGAYNTSKYKDDSPETVIITVTVSDTLNVAPDGTAILGRHDVNDGTYGQNISQLGNISALTDGIKNGSGSLDTNLANNQANFNYGFVGVTWLTARTDQVRTVKVTMNAFGDGGWFGDDSNDPANAIAPVLQTSTDGITWVEAQQTNDYIAIVSAVAAGSGLIPEVTFNLNDSVTGITGIRLFGENGGTAITNGFIAVREIEVISSMESVTPAIGLQVSLTGSELVWIVEDEIGVQEYQISYETSEGLNTEIVVANGSDFYSLTLPDGAANVRLVVVDESGFSDPYIPEDGNIKIEVYELDVGWNLIAVTADDADFQTLKDETIGLLWGWTGSAYEVIDTARATEAIWVYSTIQKQVHISGTKSNAEIVLKVGWNMVGPVENDYIPINAHSVYSWSDIYDIIAGEDKVLIGGKGYWIFSL